jgi:hypothetical protein
LSFRGKFLIKLSNSLLNKIEGFMMLLQSKGCKLKRLHHWNYISALKLGTREPPLPVLLAYAHLAGISTDVLIDDELDLPEKPPSKLMS